MSLKQKRGIFDCQFKSAESAILQFIGVEGYDVYNCSIPFAKNGMKYIYGRVEKPDEWARSRTFLFENKGNDRWERITGSMIYQLEDPHIAIIGGEIVLGGVFVFMERGTGVGIQSFYYRGTDLEDMRYFTSGPKGMKDIRLVELSNDKIGVFSRPRSQALYNYHGSHTAIGFTVIHDLNELCAKVVDSAPFIPDLFNGDEWGGVNQAYYLDSGYIGIIGHKCYKENDGTETGLQSYLTIAWVFDPGQHRMIEEKIIATRKCFPPYRAKKPHIVDCTFPSGIVLRSDGKCDLYSGVSDSAEGRLVIEYPFKGYGDIITPV